MHEKRNSASVIVGGLLVGLQVVSAQGLPTFEVASVRENRSGGTTTQLNAGLQPRFPGGYPNPAPGQISITNAPLRYIVALAYGLQPALTKYTLKGGSDRILQTRFNILAKPPEGTPPSQTLLMLRTLLSDRFSLRVHTETQETQAYVLKMVTEGKLGPELRPSRHDCTSPSMPDDSRERARLGPKDADGEPLCGNPYGELSSNEFTIGYVSPLDLMLAYVQPFVDRPILDETGLRGSFQWTISFSPSASLAPGADPAATSIWTALQEQLGLKLEPQSRPTQVLVIDAVEMPTPN